MKIKVAVVTGAGSGVGQAVAVRLVNEGWDVVLVGRRAAALEETIKLAGGGAAVPCDVADAADVRRMGQDVINRFGGADVLVNSAGTNTPKRSLRDVTLEDYRQLIDVNLNGTFYCVQAFLPGMRDRGRGTIVNVVSDAGMWPNAVAGPGYVASKFGVTGLTGSINCEERKNGIRACAILPGEIDTPLLKKRPVMPSDEQRGRMLQADDVAACVMLAINLPGRAVVEQLVVRPR